VAPASSAFALACLFAVPGCLARATRVSVVSVDRLRVTQHLGPRAQVEIEVTVQTNAPVDSTITVLAYDLALADDPPLAKGNRLPPVRVPAGGRVRLVLPAEIALSNLPPDLPAWAAKGALPFRAVVWTESESVAGTQQHRLELNGQAPLAETFGTVVDGVFSHDAAQVVAVGPFGVEGPDLVVGVELAFPGHLPFPIKVHRVSYRMSLGGTFVGEGSSGTAFVVAPQAGGRGKFVLKTPTLGIPGVVAKLASGQRELFIEGVVEIDPIGPIRRIPFRARTTVQ